MLTVHVVPESNTLQNVTHCCPIHVLNSSKVVLLILQYYTGPLAYLDLASVLQQ